MSDLIKLKADLEIEAKRLNVSPEYLTYQCTVFLKGFIKELPSLLSDIKAETQLLDFSLKRHG